MPNVSRIEAAIPRSSECSAPSASNSRQAQRPKIIEATMNGQANNPSCRPNTTQHDDHADAEQHRHEEPAIRRRG